MKNFKMKNVILGVLIAVMSIACFAVVGVTLNNVPKYEREQGIHIAGLEFEDGWNLISDAEDYDLMAEAVNSGKGNTAKYRLAGDIDLSQTTKGIDVFSGTLDGAGFELTMGENQYNTKAKNTTAPIDNNLTYQEEANTKLASGYSKAIVSTYYGYNLAASSDGAEAESKKLIFLAQGLGSNDDGYNSMTQMNVTLSGELKYQFDNGGLDDNKTYVVGYIGAFRSATVSNVYLKFDSKVSVCGDHGWAGVNHCNSVWAGGLCGYSYNTSFSNCVVRYSSGAFIKVTGGDQGSSGLKKSQSRVGGMIGQMKGGSIKNCLVIKSSSNVATDWTGASAAADCMIADVCPAFGGATNSGLYSASLSQAKSLDSMCEILGVDNIATGWVEYWEKSSAIWFMETDNYDYSGGYDWFRTIVNSGEIVLRGNVYLTKTSVTYKGGGGTFSDGSTSTTKQVYPGKNGSLTIQGLSRTGYTQKGWKWTNYISSTLTGEFKNWHKYSTTATAEWAPITYTVKFNPNGGSGTMSDQLHTYDSSRTLSPNNFSRSGYSFTGWATSSGGNVVYNDEQSVSNLASTQDAVVNLYAKWTPVQYTITYHENGGTDVANRTYTILDEFDLPSTSREQYHFAGWYESANFDGEPVTGIEKGTIGHKNFYARWKKSVKATLDYNYKESPDGPDRTGEIKKLQYGEDYDKPLTTATTTKSGYNFLGWTSDYLDVSSFIWWYYADEGAGKVSSTTKPYVTDSGWLCLSGPMAWDGTKHWGYPIYLPNGKYQLSAIAQGSKDDQYGFGGSLLMVECDADYTVPGNISGRQQFRITVDETGPTDNVEKSGVYTVNDESGGIQFCLFHSYNTGNNVYYKDIRITRLNDDGTEAKYQGTYNRPNELRIIDAGSAVIAPYDHTLYANWSDELNVIEFDTGDGIIASMLHSNEGVEFDGENYYINLGRKYMFKDSLYVSVDAYMDNWSTLGKGTLISCTEYAGWRIAGDDDNMGKIEFELRTSNNDGYITVNSKNLASELSPGWHTFTAMYDGAKMALYIDNILQAEMGLTGKIVYNGTNSILVGGEATSIPSAPSLGDWGFKGKMRNLYIANTPMVRSYYHKDVIKFDGVDDYVDLGTQYQFTDSLYISFMAYMEDWDEYKSMHFMSCNADDGALGWEFIIDDQDKISFLVYHSQGSIIIRAKKSISDFLDKTWYKFKVVWDGSKVYYYINEELQNDSEVTLSEIAYSSHISICLGREGLGGGFFKGALSNIYISNGKGCAQIYYDSSTAGGTTYQRFPALVHSGERKFIGWALDNSNNALDLEGNMLGDTITFFNGIGFKAYGNEGYDGQILLGFNPGLSSGAARLIAKYDDATTPTPDDWPNPGGDPIDPEPGDNEIQDPQPDLNITMFTIELQYEDANINYNPSSEKASFDGIYIIYFDGHEGFALPNSSQVTRYGYKFDKWQVISSDYSEWPSGANPEAVSSGVNINAKLKAVWIENVYKVEIHSNVPDNNTTHEKTIYNHGENIKLSLNELFGLQYNIVGSGGVGGYRFVGWTVSYKNNEFVYNYNKFSDKHSNLGYAEINARYNPNATPGGENGDSSVSGITCNQFAQLFTNWGIVSVDNTYYPIIFKDITEVSELIHGYTDNELAESGYCIDIYAVWTPVYTVTIKANMLDKDNNSQHKCGHADGECKCGIYDSGKKTTAISGDGSAYIVPQDEQYDFGESTVTQTIKTQHYFKGYEIPGFDFEHVFNVPTNGFGLHYYGHEIYGWIVQANGDTYKLDYIKDANGDYIKDANGNYILEDGGDITDWIKGSDTDIMPSGINLKYLQGDIILTPQWRPVVFDVEFKTANGQGYKPNDNRGIVSQVQFNNAYVISENASSTESTVINAKTIPGYTVIYAHPYNGNSVDSSKYITTTGTWDYMLEYKTYSGGKVSPYGNKFYIEIEGYYAPDLYRVKIDLDLPYSKDDITVNNINNESFDKGFDYGDSLGDRRIYTMSPLDREGNAVEGTNYDTYQHKLIKVTEDGKDVYYIYLLQDQVVGYDENQKCAYIENAYYNGKNAEPGQVAKKYLPTFEIDYYEMQYYYAIGTGNDENNKYTLINKYQTAELEEYHKTLSDQKLKEKYGSDVTVDEKLDWKYTYNIPADNTQISDYESGNVVSTIYIYWYRNILNLDIYNMINPNDSNTAKDQTTVGYVLVTETEQVTSNLIDHKQYHLVIYAYNNGQLGYVVYEFNNISVLENSDLYKYIQLLGESDDYSTLEELNDDELTLNTDVKILAANDIYRNDKYIPIYFGNSVTIEAVDQSKDQSLNEFIGYRFRNFKYDVTDSERTNISELNGNNYDNDESKYIGSEDGRYTRSVSIDLQKYEYGKDFTEDEKDNPNITNYFKDQDLLTIKAHFEPIKYKFNYQTVNESYEYYPQAGNIQLNYEGTSVNGMGTETVSSRFAYYVNVNAVGNNTSICNYMNIELGYEHLNWYIYKNEYSQEDTTNVLIKTGDTQEFIFKVDAEFLRTYYEGNYTTDLVQDLYGYSECKLMEFNIQVHVIDVSTGADVRDPYELSTSGELFTMDRYPLTLNDKTPSNNNYTITMLKGADGYTFVTYVYGGKAYILQELYIKTAGSSITIKDFMTMYPAKDLGQYNINVTSGLLDQAITYSQYVELVEDDRVLHFYVDVAPVVTMEFEVVDSGDQNLSDRVLMIGSETIAKGLKDEEFKVEVTSDGKESTYVGYWGQDILLTFIAGNHYRSIDFEIEYVDESQKEKIDQLSIIPGNNKIYTLKGDSTAKIKIVPNTYDLTAYITYNDTHYEIGEYDLIKNAVGDNIFELVAVSAHGDNISAAGMYYTGDKFDILYQLNPEVLKDITVEVLENGDSVDMYDDDRDGVADGIIEFSNVGIELEIRVQDKGQAVKLKSNYQDKYAADIQAKVNNNANWIVVQDKTGIKNVVFNLVRGDVLTVYIKEQVGFRFNKTYSYGFAGGTVDAEEVDGGWMFTLFADGGFTADDYGTYTLNFTQIPFEVEFKHYLTTEARELEGSEIPAECIAVKDMTDNERYIQSGSKVKLSKSTDKTGYRFNGYTYVAPQGQESAIELDDEFIVDETMLQHLATVGTNEKGNVPIVIYLNYVKQYTFNISAKGASVQILDNGNKEINPSKYYDFGTEFKVKAKANDSEHYQIKASINGTEVSEEYRDDVSIPENTNLGNLSGFTTVNYTLNNNYTILVEVVAEKYSIKLNQKLNNGAGIEEDDETLATQSTWFNLSDNVYYQALGTFGYNTEVEIHIFVANPQVDESTYYVLNKVLVDGREVSVKAGNQSTVDGKQGVMYTVKHTVLGEPLVADSAITSEITVTFNALYYVTVIQ